MVKLNDTRESLNFISTVEVISDLFVIICLPKWVNGTFRFIYVVCNKKKYEYTALLCVKISRNILAEVKY